MLNKLKQIANTYQNARDQIVTEEATKTALIMPFIAALGFNVFNPLEVVPEIVADIGDKKGEKIDFALKSGDDYLMLVECKKCSTPLDQKNVSQLFRYFGALRTKLNVRIGILTNGLEYNFYADMDNDNVLDPIPFFSLNVLNVDEQKAGDLKQFDKNDFNVESIIAKAGEYKRRAGVEKLLETYMTDPPEAFVNCVLTDVFPGRKTQQIVTTYSGVIKEAFSQLIKNRVNSILTKALSQNVSIGEVEPEKKESSLSADEENEGVVTTREEIEAFAIVKTIVRPEIDVNRVFLRDSKGSCSIVMDDHQRKPLIKLFFNDSSKKRIVLFNDRTNKKGNQFPITDVFEIYEHAESIKATLKGYLAAPAKKTKDEGPEVELSDADRAERAEVERSDADRAEKAEESFEN
jgi:hypothetical protein